MSTVMQANGSASRQWYSARPVQLGILITLLILFPGFLDWDSVNQLTQARLGEFSSLHPPMMGFLWRLVEYVVTGPFGMLVLQVSAIWAGLYMLQKYYLDCNCTLGAIMPMLVVFSPPVFGILGLIAKDIQMTAWLVLAMGFAVKLVKHNALHGKVHVPSLIVFLLLIWLALGQRHNAVAAAPGLIWFVLFSVYFTGKNLVARLSLTLLMALPVTIILYVLAIAANGALASTNNRAWAQIAAYDIVGTAVYTDDPDYVDKVQLSSLGELLRTDDVTKEALISSYHPDEWTFIFRGGPFVDFWTHWPNAEESKTLVHVWLRAVQNYPSAYLMHRISVFRQILGLGERITGGVGFSDWRAFADKKKADDLNHKTTLSPLQKGVYLIHKGFKRYTPLMRPYLYGILSLVCLVAGAYCIARRIDSLPFFLAVSGLGYEFTLLLTAPAANYRYSYWMIITSLIAGILLIIRYRNQSRSPVQAADVPIHT